MSEKRNSRPLSAGQNKLGMWLLVLYLPVSGFIIGLLANVMQLPHPVKVYQSSYAEVFWAYALRIPSDFSVLRWIAPVLGWALLLLMLVAVRSRKPIMTLVEIRIVLLVLIVIITVLANIFNVVVKAPGSAPGSIHNGTENLTILLFLFVDVDLILVFLASYLWIFRPLKNRSV